ncbi:hypothetical protein CAOG_07111 [Capsaspora owczarzaki ATCC 30864]|uniref:Anaphase-promoting complex subunit 4-like WD40 domain-containing protein n=1 Tax=Capsaspora owczarzaki (strain ATCC 30864) TaxID=595528 RepID=A0A0D2WVG8_CAPO3|nr:hypothetical protein CAOG_07111 [Capsaspora owczarzaki ATCC 30864]KJE96850.1 hypothetical protein CAOG_007111 [Capsaspora owczarzaki ATCC 30864]|eukprot:XP_004343835.1 hypothetical protein CAOG_07111 [Capsaspora owczarzaki ATCC 30864]
MASIAAVLGATVTPDTCSSALCIHPTTGHVAYPAGPLVVLFHPTTKERRVVHFGTSKRTESSASTGANAITAIAIAPNGRFLAAAQSGQQPEVVVWDLQQEAVVARLKRHSHAVACVAFSPDSKLLVSVGVQHDGMVCVWNWRTEIELASNRLTSKTYHVAFTEDGGSFVTCGVRSAKIWTIERPTQPSSPSSESSSILQGKPLGLGEQASQTFTSVACGVGAAKDRIFAITATGILCTFNSQRQLENWMDVKAERCFALAVNATHLIIGGASGIIRAFEPTTLQHITSLSHPCLNQNTSNAELPLHAVSVAVDASSSRLAVRFADRSLCVWNLEGVPSLLAHETFHASAVRALSASLADSNQPQFYAGGSDCSLKLWSARELGGQTDFKMEGSISTALAKSSLVTPMSELDQMAPFVAVNSPHGITCMSNSSDGRFVAAGLQSGRIRLFDQQLTKMISDVPAHTNEVTCIEFALSPLKESQYLLASGSRDRSVLVHTVNGDGEASLLATLTEHSSSISSLRFATAPVSGSSSALFLLSASSDKSVLVRSFNETTSSFDRERVIVQKSSITDLCLLPQSPGEVAIVGGGSSPSVRVYSFLTGKLEQTVNITSQPDQSPIAASIVGMQLHPGNPSIAALVCSDKVVRVVDLANQVQWFELCGHSEGVSAVHWVCARKEWLLLTSSSDGCVVLWRIKGLPVVPVIADSKSIVETTTTTTTTTPVPTTEASAQVAAAPAPSFAVSPQWTLTDTEVEALLDKSKWMQDLMQSRLILLPGTKANMGSFEEIDAAVDARFALAAQPTESSSDGAASQPLTTPATLQLEPTNPHIIGTSVATAIAVPAPAAAKSKSSRLADEVEKTRQRLLALGITLKPSAATSTGSAIAASGEKNVNVENASANSAATRLQQPTKGGKSSSSSEPVTPTLKRNGLTNSVATPSPSRSRNTRASPRNQRASPSRTIPSTPPSSMSLDTPPSSQPSSEGRYRGDDALMDPIDTEQIQDPSELTDAELFDHTEAAIEQLKAQFDYAFLLYRHTVERQPEEEARPAVYGRWHDTCTHAESVFADTQKVLDDLLNPRQDKTMALLDQYSNMLVSMVRDKMQGVPVAGGASSSTE